jgi:hypothetical protein
MEQPRMTRTASLIITILIPPVDSLHHAAAVVYAFDDVA